MNIRALLEQSSSVLVLGHQNADPDAVCSMAAVSELYQTVNREGSIDLVCDDVSRLAMQVLEAFLPGTMISRSVERDHELVIIVDTNNRFQLGERLHDFRNDPLRTIVIDHHEPSPEVHQMADHLIVKSNKSSTCEIIIDIYDELGLTFGKATANLLLTGILFDTRRFFYGTVDTIATAVRLIKAGADYQACINALITRPDKSERIARLKAAARSQVHLIDSWIVATSRVGAFEASACRALIELGADVAIVGGSPSRGLVRLSSRSTSEFSEQTGVNLGTDVMEPLGEMIDGVGGGHPNAAGANGKRNRDKALARSVELIREAMNKGKVPVEEPKP